MEIIINENSQTVELWILTSTPQDEVDKAREQFIKAGYSVVSYYSGHDDLVDATKKLLNANI